MCDAPVRQQTCQYAICTKPQSHFCRICIVFERSRDMLCNSYKLKSFFLVKKDMEKYTETRYYIEVAGVGWFTGII